MATTRDVTVPNWTRTLTRLRRNIEELRLYGCEVKEPDDFQIPPERRIAQTSLPLQ